MSDQYKRWENEMRTTEGELRALIGAKLFEWEQAAEVGRFDGLEYETPEQEADEAIAEVYDDCAQFLHLLLLKMGAPVMGRVEVSS